MHWLLITSLLCRATAKPEFIVPVRTVYCLDKMASAFLTIKTPASAQEGPGYELGLNKMHFLDMIGPVRLW